MLLTEKLDACLSDYTYCVVFINAKKPLKYSLILVIMNVSKFFF
jgi:hypothetical protein